MHIFLSLLLSTPSILWGGLVNICVEVEPYASGGYTGIINVTAVTGRVVLSAGIFGESEVQTRCLNHITSKLVKAARNTSVTHS